MQKLKSLREALRRAVPQLKSNPDMLRLYVDSGHNVSTLAASLSFQKVYDLRVVIVDFVGDLDLIFVPVQAWLREHQPDLMTTAQGREKGFAYQVDVNSDDSLDIGITLRLTERTLVREIDGALHVSYAPEPPPPVPVTRPMELYINGELVSQWHD
ncbi:phage tail protein [Enterobacteriaceae bacterium 4M9]|nr:phage tail protein [Enterobacteriaceae bacterium 4M9]